MKKCLLVAVILSTCFINDQLDAADRETGSVLVFGGTGRLGSDVVRALATLGHEMSVFARPTSNRERLENLPVSFVIGDVLDAKSVENVFQAKQYDVVVDALGRGSADASFYRQSARNIAASAARFGVQQIILHGSVGAGDSAQVFAGSELSPGMQRTMEAKSAGERAVIESEVNFTIIRNGRLLVYGTRETGAAKLYEDQAVSGSVTREGLARLTGDCVLNKECYDKIYHAVDMSLNVAVESN